MHIAGFGVENLIYSSEASPQTDKRKSKFWSATGAVPQGHLIGSHSIDREDGRSELDL